MSKLTLTIGNKNYSSWSLRAWMAIRKSGLAFDERMVLLSTATFAQEIQRFSPSSRVPALHHGDLVVWDSLAICEYLAELAPRARLWPIDASRRAVARAVSAEMHSGFFSLRGALPMNIRARRRVAAAPGVERDIDRVQQIWRELRGQAIGGPWLFGHFTIADAMYTPVASRFATYGVACDDVCAAYRDTVLNDDDFRAWAGAAREETAVIEEDEAGEPVEEPTQSTAATEKAV